MSGHSKWHSIRFKKGIADQKRGKIFSRHSKLIEVAAKNGGDPSMNPSLRMAIENARAENMPNEKIDRAIKKGTGELKDGGISEEITYEGFVPGGIAVLVHAVTDNKNRTLSAVRLAFTKNGGNMGSQGSTAWMFEQKGLIQIENVSDREAVELAAIDAGALDIKGEGGVVEIVTAPNMLRSVRDALKASGVSVSSAKLEFLPKELMKIEDAGVAAKILKFMDALDDDEDVTGISANFDIPEEMML